MKKALVIVMFLQSLFVGAQISLPILQSNIPKNHLVVNYDFSDPASFSGTGTTVTNLASSTTGAATLSNNPGFIRTLGYVAFNGANQYLITPNLESYFKSVTATSIQESHTISLWIYPLSANGIILSEFGAGSIGASWQDSQIEMVNGTVKFRVWPGTEILNSTNTIALNQWRHIVMVYDGTSTKGYVDGVLQGTKTYARQSPINYGYDLHYGIGAYTSTQMGSAAYGKFNLAQFKMYNIPLNDSDVAQEYNRENTKFNYVVHSPDTNTNPTYWSVSSAWNTATGASGASGVFSDIGYTPWLNSGLGWIAQQNNTSQFITLNYDEPVTMKGLITQGRAELAQWVSSAHIDVSMDGLTWTRVLSNATLNSNYTEDVKLLFPSPVFAKYVRVNPLNWNNYITMRVGVIIETNKIVKDGLVLNLDAANSKSYQGSGSSLYDLTSNNTTSTLTGTPTYNPNGWLQFNGTTQHGSIPSVSGLTDFTNTQKYSIEIWFNPSNGQPNSGEAELLEKWNKNNESRYPFTFRFNESTNSMTVACYDGTTFKSVVATGFPVNTWKQIVGVFDFVAKTLTVYKDGVSVGSTSLAGINQVSNTSPIAIATRLLSTGGPQTNIMFKGAVGSIRIYNKNLSSDEVLQNYNVSKPKYDFDLVMNLASAPSSGSTWVDQSGNGYNGTLVGSPTYVSNNGGGYRTTTGQYISTNYNLPSAFTISIVASLNPTSFWATFWGNEAWTANKGYIAYFSSTSGLEAGSPPTLASFAVSGINTIHIWDFVVSGTSITLYKDGVSLGTKTFSSPTSLAAYGLYFGARHGNAGTGYTDVCPGTYYNMRVYKKALIAGEITNKFNQMKSLYGL